MHDLHAILDAWRTLEHSNRDAVLATVVHVKGSAYRRPGARMLILPDGRRIGSVSGGCLEGDVAKKAWWFTEGRPAVRVYDTSSEEDAVWEFGLGCSGVIQVLLERLETESAREAMELLDSCRACRKPAVMATVIRVREGSAARVGDHLFFPATAACDDLRPHALAALHERRSRLVHLDDSEVFVEYIGPPPALVIFGAGHDAIPVARIAKELGWHVTVADGRPAYARVERFPLADRVVLTDSGNPLAGIEIDRETCVVLMTHNYPGDGKLLQGILPARPRYLGLLGPKRRTERLFEEIGVSPGADHVHAPVGLDIGAETPEAIALSIVSEIQAVLAGRSGMKLRSRRVPIHAPAHETGEPRITAAPERAYAVCERA